MKKNLLLLAAFGVLLFQVKAQVNITISDIPGTVLNGQVESDTSNAFPLPQTGAVKTWNYSNFSPYDTIKFTLLPASGSPYASKFPNATLYSADFRSVTDSTELFLTTNTGGLYFSGIYSPGFSVNYERPQLIYPVINYGQTIHDSSWYSFDSTIMIGNVTTKVTLRSFTRQTYEAVGYGSITTPAGTFQNVLLLKETAQNFDSIQTKTPKVLLSASKSTSASYIWVQKDKTFPVVFNLGLTNDGNASDSTASYYTRNSLTSVQNPINANFFSQYPIPADQFVSIELNQPMEGVLTIYGLDGSVKNTQQNGITNKYTINTSSLPSGMYSYEIRSANGTVVRNKITVIH